MHDRIKVQDEKNLVRDAQTGAILSLDKETLNRARAARRAIKSDKERIKSLESRLERLEQLLLNHGTRQE